MKKAYKQFLFFICLFAFSSCSRQPTDPNFHAKLKFGASPQVKDILSGKSKSEILNMKYKELKATCKLEINKVTRGQSESESFVSSPNTPEEPGNPIAHPSEDILSFDLFLQKAADRDLNKEVKTRVSTTKDGQTLNVDLTLKPIVFQDAVNIDANQKKYIMKHTPVIYYIAEYKLNHSDTTFIVGKSEGVIYEKIPNQKKDIIKIEIGMDQYNFSLNCVLNGTINRDNASHAAEFDNQWVEIDCHAPKNDVEKALCK